MAPRRKDRLRAALAAFFERQSVTRTALCRRARVSESTVRGFLDGRTKTMQHDTLEKLAAAAGVTINEMLGDAANDAPGAIEREHMRAVLAEVLGFMQREEIAVSPRRFADLAMAIYGLSAAPFTLTPEIEAIIRLERRDT
jgi:transcriptional regulator with XRE-family HTH domain